jgi:hypothetical protein
MVNVVAIDLRFSVNDIFNINGKSVWEISIADLERNEVRKKVFYVIKNFVFFKNDCIDSHKNLSLRSIFHQ